MGWIMRADVTLLAVMLAYVMAITSGRFYRFAAARRHSRLFVRNAASALEDGNVDEALAVATEYARGHVARTVAAGLTAFAAAPHLTDAEAVRATERALQRTRTRLVAELKRGAGTLTSIALCAPFVGFVGTVFGIMGSFYGSGLASLARGLAEALVTTAFGLLVAIPAVWCRNYVLVSVEAFETEMSNATLETMTYCGAHCQLRHRLEHPLAGKTVYGSILDPGARSWEIPYDRPRGLLLLVSFYTMLFVLFFVLAALAAFLGAR
jgi:biopolymer transport protein ExbB/TolQ